MNLIWRAVYRFYRIMSWLIYWSQRRFTFAGWLVLAAFFVCALGALDMESLSVYQGYVLLLLLLVIGFVFSWFFRLRYSAMRLLPRFGTAGQAFVYRVRLKNLTARIQNDLTLLENPADPRPTFQEWLARQLAEEKKVRSLRLSRPQQRYNPFRIAVVSTVSVPPIPPNEEVEIQVSVTPMRRGLLRLEGLTLARTDPFGIFRAFSKFRLPETMLILPKRYPLPPIALPGNMKYQEGGVALASNVGQSDEFVALREYRRGDPLRRIHWRSWARTGKPIVREFEDEFFARHALVLDTFSDEPFSERFEEAISVAASFASGVSTQESLLDLLFVGAQAYCFTVGRGVAHVDQMLEILASVNVCVDKSFETLETLALNHVGAVSGCICVLLAWDEPRRRFVEKIKALGIPLRVMIILADEPQKPFDPGPMRDEPEHFHTLIAGQIEQGLLRM
ncbi:MAG TPA: DUF58 domain-containing protein [Candidatus Acidoferrum sp.]|jgi:uncharacterized protein (DUF58 family)|nr:DUF58 domain-containing protein [Candidatus Acidoferrum sp.]